MDTTIGTAQNSLVLTSNATVLQQNYYFTRFVSQPLSGITSVTALTWTYNFAATESNASANFPTSSIGQPTTLTAYVWRPGTGKVGNILDGSTTGTLTEGTAGAERSHNATFNSTLVSSVQDGDVICLEVFFRITQGAATSYTDTFYYDGTTVTTSENTDVTNHASFVETPQNLTFGAAAAAVQDITRVCFGGGNFNAPVPMMPTGLDTGQMQAMSDNRTIFGHLKVNKIQLD
jgi:hypothetical protein